MSPFINIEEVDWSKLSLGKSGRAVKLLYNKEPFSFCTSSVSSPFGVKSVMKEWSIFPDYYIDCSLNQYKNTSANAFEAFMEELDTNIEKLVRDNIDMFNLNEQTPLVYSPLLRENGSYPKLMKMQVTRDKNGNFESFVFDEKKQKVLLNEGNISEILTRGRPFKVIIECAKVWVYNGKIGSIWNIVQLKFQERPPQRQETNVQNNYNQIMIQD